MDRAELRRLAEAAKGWPWEHKHNAELIAIGDGMYLQIGKINDIEAAIRDGKLIAAASPDVVLGLLDEIDAMQARLDAWEQGTASACAKAMIKTADDLLKERDQLRAVAVRLKEALENTRYGGLNRVDHSIRSDAIAKEALADPEVEKL